MKGERVRQQRDVRGALRWQSQAVLLAFAPVAAVWVVLQGGETWAAGNAVMIQTGAIAVGFTLLVLLSGAASAGGALTGAVFTAALYLQTPGWHTALWPLSTLLLLTFASTRAGRRRKEALGVAEARGGRVASQVAANLGVAALAAIPAGGDHLCALAGCGAGPGMVAMLAALAEATADTMSSELGQVIGGQPRLITTLRRVAPGTDGAISWAGTAAGCAGALAVVAVGWAILPLSERQASIALGGAVIGLFVDSVLGAVPERAGWLNNDAVNAFSTLAAALFAGYLAR